MIQPDLRPKYGPPTWLICEACNYAEHRCPACGDDLEHTEASPHAYPNRERHPCYEPEPASDWRDW